MNDRSRNRRIRHSRSQEQATAKRLGGHVTPASGALPGAGGDVRSDKYLIENKRTDKKSMSVKLEWLHKITQQASRKGCTPLIEIEFGNGVQAGGERWYLVPDYLLDELP